MEFKRWALGAALLFARVVAAAIEIDTVTAVVTLAIEGGGACGVDLPGDFLGGIEALWGFGEGGQGEQQAKQDKQVRHGLLGGKKPRIIPLKPLCNGVFVGGSGGVAQLFAVTVVCSDTT